MDNLIIQYQNTNAGPDLKETQHISSAEVQTRLSSEIQQKMREYQELRNKVIEEIPKFQLVKDVNEILQDGDLGNEIAETSLEVLCRFNEEMKFLAMNAF